jgi:hypothetical protein
MNRRSWMRRWVSLLAIAGLMLLVNQGRGAAQEAPAPDLPYQSDAPTPNRSFLLYGGAYQQDDTAHPLDIAAAPPLPSGWALVPGGGSTPSAPAATVFQGNLALFVRGTNDGLYVNWLLPNDQWTGWALVPGGGSTPSAPAATVFQGNLALFVRGTDNGLYVNWLLPAYQWTGWMAVPGGETTPSAPAATVLDDDLALFVQGEDNQLYVNFTVTGP